MPAGITLEPGAGRGARDAARRDRVGRRATGTASEAGPRTKHALPPLADTYKIIPVVCRPSRYWQWSWVGPTATSSYHTLRLRPL